MNNKIHIPTEEENKAALAEFFTRQNRVRQERTKAVVAAVPALKRLAKVLCERSGQCYKVRALLYSLWNGKPVQMVLMFLLMLRIIKPSTHTADINEVLGLDWEIRQDVCAVILAFGFEDNGVEFFYQAIEKEIRDAQQWNWFLQERFEYKVLEDYAKAHKEAQEEAGNES